MKCNNYNNKTRKIPKFHWDILWRMQPWPDTASRATQGLFTVCFNAAALSLQEYFNCTER